MVTQRQPQICPMNSCNLSHLIVKVTGSGDPFTLNLNSSVNCPRTVELKEIWMTWSPSGKMVPSWGRKVKEEPRAVAGGTKLKIPSMGPLLNRIACSSKKAKQKYIRNLPFLQKADLFAGLTINICRKQKIPCAAAWQKSKKIQQDKFCLMGFFMQSSDNFTKAESL